MTIAVRALMCLVPLRLATAGNSIEFSVREQKFTSEGMNYRRLVFKDDKQLIFYQPPNRWSCRVTDNQLCLLPPERPMCEGRIESSPAPQPAAGNENAAAAFAQQVLAALPSGSRRATIIKQEENGLLVNGYPTFEVIVSYEAFGQSFRRSVLQVNAPANQIRFQFTSGKSDFDLLYRPFRSSILSWEWQPAINMPNGSTPVPAADASATLQR